MSLRHASLRRLQVFEAVARLQSFSRAAAELHLTQPAVSMQVQQLEDEVGAAAVRADGPAPGHHARGPRNRGLRPRADAAPARGRRAARGNEGRRRCEIAISAVSTAKYHVPMLLAEFRRKHPGVRVRLSVSNREQVVRDLTENSVDLAIMGAPPRGLDTIAVPFARHPIAIIAPPGHALARGKRLPLARPRPGDLSDTRTRLGNAQRHGARVPRTALSPARNDRDELQRNHQAGGDGGGWA